MLAHVIVLLVLLCLMIYVMSMKELVVLLISTLVVTGLLHLGLYLINS